MSRGRISTVLEMIKFEHSVFALPFALTGALLAARATRNGWPTLWQVLWIVVAMVAARSAAMTMNRIADLRYDRENPRTKQRALVTGALSLEFAWVFTLLAVGAFFVAAWQLNSLALKLAPLALAILFFYSFTKRFTTWSHLFLGFALGISPAAAWIAITGGLNWRMLVVCGAEKIRDCERIADRARNAHRRNCAAELAGAELWIALAGVGGDCASSRPARIRTFAGESERFEQAGRCVFHGERLY